MIATYLHLWRNHGGFLGVGLSDNAENNPEDWTPIEVFEIVTTGGDDIELREYREPERFFAVRAHQGHISPPQPKPAMGWAAGYEIFEVMPVTGDYRKLSVSEIAELRAESKKRS